MNYYINNLIANIIGSNSRVQRYKIKYNNEILLLRAVNKLNNSRVISTRVNRIDT